MGSFYSEPEKDSAAETLRQSANYLQYILGALSLFTGPVNHQDTAEWTTQIDGEAITFDLPRSLVCFFQLLEQAQNSRLSTGINSQVIAGTMWP